MAFIFKLARCFNCNFLLSSLVREDVFLVRVSSGRGGGLGTGRGFKYQLFAREKEQRVRTEPVRTSHFAVTACARYLTLGKLEQNQIVTSREVLVSPDP